MAGAPEIVEYEGVRYALFNGRIILNWHGRKSGVTFHKKDCRICCTWSADSHLRPHPTPCHICGLTSHLKDDDGRPVHKTCLEDQITRKIMQAGVL